MLGYFQLLEFALKNYVGLSYDVIQARVNGIAHFDSTESNLDDLPLGRLLNLFKKLNSNAELLGRLQKLQAERNHISRLSLPTTMGPLYDRPATEDRYIEDLILEVELVECLQAVSFESKQLQERARHAV